MCIAVFLWQAHPLYPFLLLLNRDEYHSRPSKPVGWWEGGEILGGKDELSGGTWLGCNRDGKIAFITNVREVKSSPQAKTRGDLTLRFLESNKNPKEYAEELSKEADQYNGFNLILADISSKSMVYLTNRPKPENLIVMEVTPGMHVLSNASLDSPWPKAQRLGHGFKDFLEKYGEAELPTEEMVEILMTSTIKDDESMLPGIYPSEREYQLSSIFVETDTPLGRYGTRSTSALSVKSSGEVNFYERYLDKDQWKEHTMSCQIKKMEEHGRFNSVQ
ncbi:SER/THR-RICH PROTEIN T10 IN DGCR REGION [Salix purpurea]|uniref:SER/THR-RICH PROTEIN T10 IN DGCR REGION n=1 Tax=Salix purpurea TaxID=77065 RepID=A0A9Q0WFQ7_SALPP|nr:SER/THR-RICH PROTEIN T10 IN DGCR REGION [Salix purpurea]